MAKSWKQRGNKISRKVQSGQWSQRRTDKEFSRILGMGNVRTWGDGRVAEVDKAGDALGSMRQHAMGDAARLAYQTYGRKKFRKLAKNFYDVILTPVGKGGLLTGDGIYHSGRQFAQDHGFPDARARDAIALNKNLATSASLFGASRDLGLPKYRKAARKNLNAMRGVIPEYATKGDRPYAYALHLPTNTRLSRGWDKDAGYHTFGMKLIHDMRDDYDFKRSTLTDMRDRYQQGGLHRGSYGPLPDQAYSWYLGL